MLTSKKSDLTKISLMFKYKGISDWNTFFSFYECQSRFLDNIGPFLA